MDNNIEHSIKELELKIATLEEIKQNQVNRQTTGTYELEQLNKGIESLKAQSQRMNQSYMDIINHEKMKQKDTYQLINDIKKEQGLL